MAETASVLPVLALHLVLTALAAALTRAFRGREASAEANTLAR